jgi:cytochrome b
MLLVLLAQVATGLVGDDETAFTGPLNRLVSTATGLRATWYHKQVGQWLLVALIVLHIAAVLWYLRRKRQNLVRPMIAGDKVLQAPAKPSRDDLASRSAAVVVLLACAGLVTWVVRLGAAP